MKFPWSVRRHAAGALAVAFFLSFSAGASELVCAPPGEEKQCVLVRIDMLIREGNYDDAYILAERGLMLDPDSAPLRAALARILVRMGAYQAANDLHPVPGASNGQLVNRNFHQRLDVGLGWSDNRKLQPRLNSLTLSVPDVGGVELSLSEPMKPNPGPLYWLGWEAASNAGNAYSMRVISSPDGTLGSAWLRGAFKLLPNSGWWASGEVYKRLDADSQVATTLGHQLVLAKGWTLESQIAIRQDFGTDVTHADAAVALSTRLPIGQIGLQVQRSMPVSGISPGGNQWRYVGAYSVLARLEKMQLNLTYQYRYIQDDETYHPWFDEGRPRNQRSNQFLLRAEYPLASGLAAWASLSNERLHSNIALYGYRRNEIFFGISRLW